MSAERDGLTPSKLEEALALGIAGFAVLPLHFRQDDGSCSCRKGAECGNSTAKHPRHPWTGANWGRQNASLDPAVIKSWFKNEPDLNVGIVLELGALPLIDIDVDMHAGIDGRATF